MKLIPIEKDPSLKQKGKMIRPSKILLTSISPNSVSRLQSNQLLSHYSTQPDKIESSCTNRPSFQSNCFKVTSQSPSFKFFTNFTPRYQRIQNVTICKSEDFIPVLPKLNYSIFRDFHNSSHQKKNFLKRTSKNEEKLARIKERLNKRKKKEEIDTKETLKNTIFARPAVTYADKLVKLHHIAML